MQEFNGRVAVITGAASGLGRALARHAARLGMKLVLADIETQALAETVEALRASGAEAVGIATDVADAGQMDALARAASAAYGGKVHLLCNNAGVAASGPLWEHSGNDWTWVLGVNLMGVAHGIRVFTPLMLAHGEPAHIVNTASVAGLLCAPAMGLYNASKHAVLALSETLFHDLKLAGGQLDCSVLCPAFVPTGIAMAERNRPAALANPMPPSAAQRRAARQNQRAVAAGQLSAERIAELTFAAVRARQFYIVTHPDIMASVARRHDEIHAQRNPTFPDPL